MLNPKIINAWEKSRSICTDTRKLRLGDIFFALKGENFNGNEFAASALENGAYLAIVDDIRFIPQEDDRFVLVPDALKCLHELALYERKQRKIPFVAITGTNGKTTTKELLTAILSKEKKVYSTQGNLNNHIGVPLTILSMPPDTEIAVIEMGANKPGDIAELCEIALPTHCLITNIGQAHLELFGNLDGVEKTKGELFDFARQHDCSVFVNEKDDRVVRRTSGILRKTTCGLPGSDFYLSGVNQYAKGMKVVVSAKRWESPHTFSSSLIGGHNAENILLAIAVGAELGITLDGIRKGIESYIPTMNRSQFLQGTGYTILLDAYNANPSSMEAVIRNIFATDYGRVALILGDMFELGNQSEVLHRELGKLILEFPVSKVIGVGQKMKAALEECAVVPQVWFQDVNEAADKISNELKGIDFVLIKGSRGMALERLVKELTVGN